MHFHGQTAHYAGCPATMLRSSRTANVLTSMPVERHTTWWRIRHQENPHKRSSLMANFRWACVSALDVRILPAGPNLNSEPDSFNAHGTGKSGTYRSPVAPQVSNSIDDLH